MKTCPHCGKEYSGVHMCTGERSASHKVCRHCSKKTYRGKSECSECRWKPKGALYADEFSRKPKKKLAK